MNPTIPQFILGRSWPAPVSRADVLRVAKAASIPLNAGRILDERKLSWEVEQDARVRAMCERTGEPFYPVGTPIKIAYLGNMTEGIVTRQRRGWIEYSTVAINYGDGTRCTRYEGMVIEAAVEFVARADEADPPCPFSTIFDSVIGHGGEQAKRTA